ncbi:MAG: hypothetical protein C0600_15995 [Ignavibacteria bacterium]|nr:MAG: hypothetical protein C0600_15995 [Ignavibacteria bacterium]
MITRVGKQLLKVKIEFALLGLLSSLFILFSVLRNGDFSFGPDLLAGCILSVTNAFLGYVFVERAFRLNDNMFMLFSMAAMAVRFFLMIAAVAVFLVTATGNILEFVGSFMAFYTIFLVFEVLHINRKTDLLKVQRVAAR